MRVNNHIKSAVGNLSQHKGLSHDILTTSDFGQICPVLAVPMLPRDKFKLRASCFARVAPMIFPTYGHCQVVTNFHSVQYSQVWKDFDIFVSGQRFSGTNAIHFPIVNYSTIANVLSASRYSYQGDASADNNDLIIISPTGTYSYRFLTPAGRYYRKFMNLLGYPFIRTIDQRTDFADLNFSALPLLSMLKVYVDYYQSRQYSNTSSLREVLREAYSGVNGSYWTAGPTIESVPTIKLSSLSFFVDILLLFPSDYFTSAQTYPTLVGGSTPISIDSSVDASSGRSFYQPNYLDQTSNDNRYFSTVSNGMVSQTSPMHRILDNFENMIRRFNLVGSREIDRIRAQFGITPKVSSNQYSRFIGGFASELHVQDVTSTSAEPSVDNYLGSYAGKGIVSDGDSFTVDSDDFGMLIGLSFIKVRPLYAPGLNREILKTSFFSYYNPDFDHGYSQAIAVGELKSDVTEAESISDLITTFGYQNAYDEYRFIPSRVTGDFLDEDSLPWSFVRDNVGTVAQSDSVIYQSAPNGSITGTPYNEFQRIFVDGSNRDHFYLYFNFDISALRPVRTSSECFDLGVGNVSTSNNPVI